MEFVKTSNEILLAPNIFKYAEAFDFKHPATLNDYENAALWLDLAITGTPKHPAEGPSFIRDFLIYEIGNAIVTKRVLDFGNVKLEIFQRRANEDEKYIKEVVGGLLRLGASDLRVARVLHHLWFDRDIGRRIIINFCSKEHRLDDESIDKERTEYFDGQTFQTANNRRRSKGIDRKQIGRKSQDQ